MQTLLTANEEIVQNIISYCIWKKKKKLGGYVYANTSRQMPNRNHHLKDMSH